MSIRTKRLGEVLKRDLGEIIQRNYQPEGVFVTITKVLLTPDLSIAKVYLSIFAPGRDEQQLYEYLDDHVPAIRHKLAGRIKNQVRKIPELHFFVDDTAEYVNKMESLFKKIEKPSDSNPEEEK